MEAGALRAPAGLARISVAGSLLRLRSDEQLVAAFRAGNDAAFQVIHDRYRQRLYAYARQMLGGSRPDAEDALQDVFLRAYNALRASDRPVSLRAWLYRVAHNRCIDHLRRPVPPAAELLETRHASSSDALAEAERREDLRRLVQDVRRLPAQQRSALLMREIDGLSYAEMAGALDATVPAVKSLLVRARIGLVEAVEARDTACADIRDDLLSAMDRGVRASGRARRHVRDCDGCDDFRTQLRGVRHGFGALTPATGPLTALAKLVGLGGAGSAGAAGAVGGGAGGGAVVSLCGTGAAKVAAVVGAAAITAGGAAEVRDRIAPATPAPAHAATASPAPMAAGLQPGALLADRGANGAAERRAAARKRSSSASRDRVAARGGQGGRPGAAVDTPISPHVLPLTAVTPDEERTGGVAAPKEPPAPAPAPREEGLRPLLDRLLGRDRQPASAPQQQPSSQARPAGEDGAATAPSSGSPSGAQTNGSTSGSTSASGSGGSTASGSTGGSSTG